MSTRDIVLIALFAAVMAILGAFPPLMIPAIGVPITAQSMGPMLMGGILGARRGGLSMLLFLLLVALGLPLLSGGRGGLGVFVGPWSGFIYGWLAATLAIGWLTERFWARMRFVQAFLIAAFGGIGVIYACGVPWYAALSGMPLGQAFLASALAFVPGDLLKAPGADAVRALLVFLNLLEGDAQAFAELFLAHAKHGAAQADPTPDMNVDRVRLLLVFYHNGGPDKVASSSNLVCGKIHAHHC